VLVPADLVPVGQQSKTLQSDGAAAIRTILRCDGIRFSCVIGTRIRDEVGEPLTNHYSAAEQRKNVATAPLIVFDTVAANRARRIIPAFARSYRFRHSREPYEACTSPRGTSIHRHRV